MDLAIFVILPFLAVIPIYLLRRIRLLAVGLSLGVLAAQAGALQNIPLDRQAEFLNIAIVLDVPTRALLLLTLAVSAFLLLVAWRTATDELLPAVVPALIALAGLALMAQDTMVAGTLLILYALGALVLVPRGAPDGSAPALKPLVIIAPAFVCFVLAAGWEQTYQLNPDFTYLQERMAIVWALAFAAIMAVIPFHLVVPSLGQGRITGLVYALFLVDGIALIQMLRLLGSRPWLPELTMPWLTTAGVLMVLIGGVLAVGQNRLGRIVAYAVVADLGWLLVGVGTATSLGLTGAVLHVGSRILVLALLGGVVAIVRR
ncbi:MAG: hypothetical protein KJ734_09240, partial [Chloroflexi bacterium]|nr:hypothetical protein [Chloroflexota bacterium]